MTGAVAVVTGAGRGIGRRVAEVLADEGYALALTDLQEPTEVLAAVRGRGVEALGVAGDVAADDQVTALAGRVLERFGRVDVLVNNAGISLLEAAEDTAPARWRRGLEGNLTGPFLLCQGLGRRVSRGGGGLGGNLAGPFLLCQALGRAMLRARSGSIVNVASIAGLQGIADRAAYNASKHGLVGLTPTLAPGGGGP